MDPKANQLEQNRIAASIIKADQREGDKDFPIWTTAVRLAQLVLDLAVWRERGGFEPEAKPATPPMGSLEYHTAWVGGNDDLNGMAAAGWRLVQFHVDQDMDWFVVMNRKVGT